MVVKMAFSFQELKVRAGKEYATHSQPEIPKAFVRELDVAIIAASQAVNLRYPSSLAKPMRSVISEFISTFSEPIFIFSLAYLLG